MRRQIGGNTQAVSSVNHILHARTGTSSSSTSSMPGAKKSKPTSRQILGKGHPDRVIGSIMSAEQINAMAVCDLSESTGDKTCLQDIRMGPREFGEKCGTCKCSYGACLGHFGKMTIPDHAWFPHPYFVKDGTIVAVLNLFCYECFKSRLQFTEDDKVPEATMLFTEQMVVSYSKLYRELKRQERLKALASKAKGMKCAAHTCTYFKKTNELTIVEILNKETPPQEIEPKILKKFLESISNYLDKYNLHAFIGFEPTRYENFIIQVIPVIPTADRPATIINGKKHESDFTSLYWTLLNIIREMNLNEGSEHKLEGLRKTLRDTYMAYIDSEANTSMKGRSKQMGDALKTMSNVISGKKGMFHRNVLSSRVDNSGRTVVAGSNSIKPNEAGIPMYMAEKFRIKLDIDAANIDVAEGLLRKGIIKVVVRNPGGATLDVKEINETNRESFKLMIGDKCYRRLVSGDIVIINRQPTLHRWSVMAMRAIVNENELPGKEINTILTNTVYAAGFNMDYDGDEVHIHVPESIEARAEAAALMGVERAPISDQTSQNIFGLIQNTVWGAYKMTQEPKNIEREEWMRMTSDVDDFPAPPGSKVQDFNLLERVKYVQMMVPKLYAKHGVKGLGIWNTRSLISLAFPPDFSYRFGNGDTGVFIDRGILISGVFTKGITGAGHNSIIRRLFEAKGPTSIVIYVHVMQQVVSAWMETQGFTISLQSFSPDETLEEKVNEMMDQKLRKIEEIGQSNVHGIFNRDLMVKELERWISIPEQLLPYISKQDFARLVNEITYQLFNFMHVERNLYAKGRSEILFRPDRVTDAIKKAIDMIIETPEEIIRKGAGPGKLLTLGRVYVKSEAEIAKDNANVVRLKELILEQINDKTVKFIEKEMISPFDENNLSTQSLVEKATIEANALDELDSIKGEGKMLLKKYPGTAREAIDLVTSGARGNESQLIQSKVTLAQQTMSNARLKEAISGGTRVTPFFLENDPNPEHRGFIRNSFYSGLTPAEWISAAMPARQTQTDTAFKTGETGYMQKRLMAGADDFIVHADGTVRDERGNIVTFLYGGLGFDPSRMVKVSDNFTFVDVDQLIQEINADEDAIVKTRTEYYRKF